MPRKSNEICLIAGARPNFMKIAPILTAMKKYPGLSPYLVHTGQHYDRLMSKQIFGDLELPRPNENLDVGSGSHAEQTGLIMERLEKILLRRRPGLVVVVGDVNSTLAGTLVAKKLLIPVAHVESGLRSFDRTMPEEINRLVTDSLSDYLFTHCQEADRNLLREGVPKRRIFFVGNVMIDSLKKTLPAALRIPPLSPEPYALVTLHRPSNVDDPRNLRRILRSLGEAAKRLPILFPVHPRTRKQIRGLKMKKFPSSLHLTEPLPYLQFLSAMAKARLVLTDSGGIQEETTALGVSCLTFRETSERMITVREGTNRVIGTDPGDISTWIEKTLRTKKHPKPRPRYWDGRAAERIVKILRRELS